MEKCGGEQAQTHINDEAIERTTGIDVLTTGVLLSSRSAPAHALGICMRTALQPANIFGSCRHWICQRHAVAVHCKDTRDTAKNN